MSATKKKFALYKMTLSVKKKILSFLNSWYLTEWKKPKLFLFKGFGLTIMKTYRMFIPTWEIRFGKIYFFVGYVMFHNGVGFSINFPPLLSINICTSGKIGWWYKKGIIGIWIYKWHWDY